MSAVWRFAALLLVFCKLVQAQNNDDCPSAIIPIIVSVFATVGVFIILLLLYLLYDKCVKSNTKEKTNPVNGYDNLLVVADEEKKKVKEETDTKEPFKNSTDNIFLRNERNSGLYKENNGKVVNVFLDQKQAPTNGFDVIQTPDDDIVVSSVRENGPAKGKIQEGDIIESITVLFDGVPYEDALTLLSKAAPHKVAISVSRESTKDQKKKESSSSNEKLYPSLEADENDKIQVTNASLLQASARPTERLRDDVGKKSDLDSSSCSDDEVTIIQQQEYDHLSHDKEDRTGSVDAVDDSSSSASSSSDEATFHVDPSQEQLPRVELETPQKLQSKNREDIVFTSGWRKTVKLRDLIDAGLVEESTVKQLEFGEVEEDEVAENLRQFLKGSDPIAGVKIVRSQETMSLYDATKEKILRRGTAVSLLEAQAATGSIINPHNADKMNVEEATKEGLLDPQLSAVLARAEKAVLGFKTMLADKPLSLFEAMKRKLVMESHGVRLLEAQIATGGIIDPYANHRLPVEVAFKRGLFDERLHRTLETPEDDTKGFFDPNTNENLTYLELMDRCIVDEETGLVLLPIHDEKQHKDYWKKQ